MVGIVQLKLPTLRWMPVAISGAIVTFDSPPRSRIETTPEGPLLPGTQVMFIDFPAVKLDLTDPLYGGGFVKVMKSGVSTLSAHTKSVRASSRKASDLFQFQLHGVPCRIIHGGLLFIDMIRRLNASLQATM